MLNKCKHDFKPHKFIKCIKDDCGKVYYLYELQCMKCGKIPMFKSEKSREKLELYDFKMEQLEQQIKQREELKQSVVEYTEMEDFYKVHNICKIMYAEEEFPFIELTTDSDFQYYFYVGQPLIVITDVGEKYDGVLSSVEDTYFKIRTDRGTEATVAYIETYGIIGKPNRE